MDEMSIAAAAREPTPETIDEGFVIAAQKQILKSYDWDIDCNTRAIETLEKALSSLQHVVGKMQVSMIGMYERLAALEAERAPRSSLILPDRLDS